MINASQRFPVQGMGEKKKTFLLQLKEEGISDARVLRAIDAVPRHLFMSEPLQK